MGAGADVGWEALANSPHSEFVPSWFWPCGLCAGEEVGVFAGGGAILTPPGGGGKPPAGLVRGLDFDETSLPSFFLITNIWMII